MSEDRDISMSSDEDYGDDEDPIVYDSSQSRLETTGESLDQPDMPGGGREASQQTPPLASPTPVRHKKETILSKTVGRPESPTLGGSQSSGPPSPGLTPGPPGKETGKST